MNLIKKFNGIANTDNKKRYYEEYYGSGGSPVSLGSIWYDAHQIPSIPPTSNTAFVKIISGADLQLVSGNAYKLTSNCNDLKYAIFGSGCVNSVNPYKGTTEIMSNPYTGETGDDLTISVPTSIDYFPIIELSDGSIAGPLNSVYIDHFSGLLYVETGVPVRITFHKYVGRLGVAIDTPANWINPITKYKTTIFNSIIIEPSTKIYYFYISTTDNSDYKAGELFVNFTSTTAVVTERNIESTGADIPVYFEAEIINGEKILLHIINITGTYNLFIEEQDSTLYNKIPSNIKLTNITNGSQILTLNKSNLGVVCYYTILDTDTNTIQQAGKLNYVWNSFNEITGENPSINYPAINTTNTATFTPTIVGDDFILTINDLDFNSIVELKYLTYNTAAVVTLNAPSQIIDFIDRTINGYKIYKFKINDNAGNTIAGEIAIICDTSRAVVANINFKKSSGVGIAGDSIAPDFNSVTRDINFLVDEDATGVFLKADIQTGSSFEMRYFAKTTELESVVIFPSTNPSNVNPVILSTPNVIIPQTNTIYPYVHVIDTLNTTEHAHIYFITATNDTGCKTTKQIAIYYTPNNPPPMANPAGTGSFISSSRTLQKDIGDCSNLTISARWNGGVPELIAEINAQVWNFAVCHINMIANYTNFITVPGGNTGILDTNLFNNNGDVYYYLIKQGNNMRMGDTFLSYDNTGANSVFDSSIEFIDNIGSIGNTAGITLNSNVGVGATSIDFVAINGTLLPCDVYIFKAKPISNLISATDSNGVPVPNSIIKTQKTITLPANSTTLIDEFKETDLIKINNATTNNPNKIDELIVSKLFHYTLNNGTNTRTGEIMVQWQSSTLNVDDRYSIPNFTDVIFTKNVLFVNNTYLYQIFAVTPTISHTIKISPTLILSNLNVPINLINTNTSSSQTLASPPGILRSVIKFYNKLSYNSVYLNYVIRKSGRQRAGSLRLLWDSVTTPEISEIGTPMESVLQVPVNFGVTNVIIGGSDQIALYADIDTSVDGSSYFIKVSDVVL